jgi:hypothetical protein
MDRTSAEATPHEFCKTKGGFEYAINFANQNWNGPYFNVAAFDKSKPLPQNYEIIKDHGDYKINYIYTWQKR